MNEQAPPRKKRQLSFQQETDRHARAFVKSIQDDLDAYHHARNCEKANCKRGSETRTVKLKDGRTVKQQRHNEPEAWHNEDMAVTAIKGNAYGIEVRSGWHDPGAADDSAEYRITTEGGGPASRVGGDLNSSNDPETVYFEFQDWFKPWTRARLKADELATLLEFAQFFYYGDEE